jgi:hypothetical protein
MISIAWRSGRRAKPGVQIGNSGAFDFTTMIVQRQGKLFKFCLSLKIRFQWPQNLKSRGPRTTDKGIAALCLTTWRPGLWAKLRIEPSDIISRRLDKWPGGASFLLAHANKEEPRNVLLYSGPHFGNLHM